MALIGSGKRIIKNNGLYNYTGVTHEYINCPDNSITYNFNKNELFINDIGDGGSKGNKIERDIKLLLNGIENEPSNKERYYFYLANTYKDSGRYNEAIENYKKRIELGGWDQEIWQSMYKIGQCYKDMGNIDLAIINWMNAYNLIPKRIENLYSIIKYYRETSKHNLALMFYDIAIKNLLETGKEKDTYLFLENDVYSYKLLYEYTIFAYYIGKKNIDNEIIQILNVKNIDYTILTNILNNFKFYSEKLKPIKTIDLTDKLLINLNNDKTSFNSSSSCLILDNSDENGYLLNVRFVNYMITSDGSYINCDKHIATINKFIYLNNDFSVKSEKLFDLNFIDKRYVGVEDVRIYRDVNNNNIIFIGTGLHDNYKIGIVNGNYDLNSDKLISKELNCTFNNNSCEKNWVYTEFMGTTHVIYKWYPLQICQIIDEPNQIVLKEEKEMPHIFSYVRGSTCGFKYSAKTISENSNNIKLTLYTEEIWFIGHLVSYESPRQYYHLFVVFDENMNLLRYSAPFKFEGEAIEYCLSLIVKDEEVIINYSCWDRTTKIGVYDKTYIDSLVKFNM
jgi:tetratricopeptide (TPR) repeat protein